MEGGTRSLERREVDEDSGADSPGQKDQNPFSQGNSVGTKKRARETEFLVTRRDGSNGGGENVLYQAAATANARCWVGIPSIGIQSLNKKRLLYKTHRNGNSWT